MKARRLQLFASVFVSGVVLGLLAGCAGTGGRGASPSVPPVGPLGPPGPLSGDQVNQVGDLLHGVVLASFDINKDPAQHLRLEAVVARVTQAAGDLELVKRTTLLSVADANSFVLPGGYLYVTEGLLALADNEAMLAAAIAHEVAHLQDRRTHDYWRETLNRLLDMQSAGFDARGERDLTTGSIGKGHGFKDNRDGRAGLRALQSWAREFAADRDGVRLLMAAGYDGQAMVDLLRALPVGRAAGQQVPGAGGAEADAHRSGYPPVEARVRAVLDAIAGRSVGTEPVF